MYTYIVTYWGIYRYMYMYIVHAHVHCIIHFKTDSLCNTHWPLLYRACNDCLIIGYVAAHRSAMMTIMKMLRLLLTASAYGCIVQVVQEMKNNQVSSKNF